MDSFQEKFLQKDYQIIYLRINLSQMPEERAQAVAANRPGVSGMADVVGERLIQICL